MMREQTGITCKTSTVITTKEIRKLSGMSRCEFAKYFNIPNKSIYNWEAKTGEKRKCPIYLRELMEFRLFTEGRIGQDKNIKHDTILLTGLSIKEMREKTGMSRREFASYFHISYESIYNWEVEIRMCPTYLMNLMEYKLRREEQLK